MPRWTVLAFLVLLTAACAPTAAPTPTPIGKAPTAAPAPTKAAPEPTKPAAVATPTTPPKAAAVTPASKPAVKPLDPTVTVKIGSTTSLTDGFFYIADAKGYFAEEGLKAEFVRFRTAGEVVAPLGTGELDVGGGSPSPALFNAIARGIPVKIVGDRYTARPGQGTTALLVRKDLADGGQVRDYSDLRGKNIAINATGSSTEIMVEKALEKGGVKREEVNVVTMPFPDMLAALGSKAIDVAGDVDPYNAMAVDRGLAVRWKGEDEINPNHETAVILFGPSFYQNKPEAARRFMVAYIRAVRDYVNAFTKNTKKQEIVSILTQVTDVKDPALYDKMAVIGVDPDGRVNAQSISADQDWYASKGYQQQKVDMSKVVDNQFVEYALERLGKY